MNAEVKTAWVAALRSGQYKQGKNCLRDKKNHWCCLAVLCDLYVQARQATGDSVDWELQGGLFSLLDQTLVLPQQVQEWAGLDSDNPAINVQSTAGEYLATLNDADASFEEIAGLIEAQY